MPGEGCDSVAAAAVEASGESSGEVVVTTEATQSFVAGADADDADDAEECGICMQDIREVGGAVKLPCDCRLSYCHRCWDRTLAASMSAVGQPRCPSCRSPLRVDFDARTNKLVFSREIEHADGAGSQSRSSVYDINNETRKRLNLQVKSKMIEILVTYCSAVAGVQNGGSDSSLPDPPRCPCGGDFERLQLRERVHRLVEPRGENGTFVCGGRAYNVPQLLAMGAITCDLCDRNVHPSEHVWTCENGAQTILHAHWRV
eukprot:TRINITY_DN9798_c0_g1_i1.p2 TRINITY_DN9798_c0_g1~~TRINITY_DN9798_c0_g1_i1.p2  ORF type:complete len:273 (-),score=43.99 TRINITY_DN9798_c0_g1_i1:1196-1972(-)